MRSNPKMSGFRFSSFLLSVVSGGVLAASVLVAGPLLASSEGSAFTSATLVGNDASRQFTPMSVPVAAVDPEFLEQASGPDEIQSQVLTISNLAGVAELSWDIGTAATPSVVLSSNQGQVPAGAGLSSSPGSFGQSLLELGSNRLASGSATPIMLSSIDCDTAEGLIINDDGSIENGYSGNPATVDSVTLVEGFAPVEPGMLGSVCISFVSNGPTTLDFELVVFDDDGVGGSPGTEIAAVSASASGVPIWPVSAPTWFSVDLSALNILVESGVVYIGARWVPSSPNTFLAADQSGSTSGIAYFQANAAPWEPIGTPEAFPNYSALFVRPQVLEIPTTGCAAPESIGWLSVSPAAGTTAAGASSPVTVDFDSTGLTEGSYEALLCLNSNDPANPLIEVPVLLEVGEAGGVSEFLVTPSAGVGGSIDPDEPVSVEEGQTTDFTIGIDEGYSLILPVGGTCGGLLDGSVFSTDPIFSDCTVEAAFSLNSYNVTFLDWDDTILDTQLVDHGNSAVAPPDPTRLGYTFIGWSIDFSNVTSDLTVTAQYQINTYTVTFVDWDNSELSVVTVDHGAAATAPPDPTRDGYTFTGWSVDFSSVTSDLTVTALYEINTYTVTFLDWDNSELSVVTVDHGSAALPPPDPTREGYTFTGWDVDFSNVTSNLTVMAQYEINTYTVTFQDWDEGELSVQTVEHGSDAEAPADPERVGYTFTGWDVDFSNVTSNLTVTAQYEINTYTVTFQDWDESELSVQTVEHGSAAEAPADPERVGYTFTGWDVDFSNVTSNLTVTALYEINTYTVTFQDWDESELSVQTVEHGSAAEAPADPERVGYTFTGWDVDFSNVTSNLTVTAQYEINTYTVSFVDWNGEELSVQTVEHGSDAEAPADPERVGYTFIGWNVDFSNVTSNLTVTAQYEINTYTVTFLDWDNSELSVVTVDHGTAATAPPDPERVGYTFTGWSVDFSNVTSDLTVTALYEINTYTVTFLDWDSSQLSVQTVEHGSDATAPADPERDGYTFTGWDVDFSNVTSNLTVTAQYEINTYTVTFQDWDESELSVQTVEHGSAAEAPADPERVGYTFTGWDVDFSNVTSNLTVTALYEINTYTVTFQDWDESELSVQTVEHGSAAEAPADPERVGYTFTGWDVDFSNVTSNLTVTALYEINTYTVTFQDWDESELSVQTVEHGSAAEAPADPERVGYTFTGWDVDFSNVTSNLTVTAQYEINTYTITASAGTGGSITPEGEVSVEHGQAIVFTLAAEDGYAITDVLGSCGGDLDGNEFTTDPVTEDCTVEAAFEEIPPAETTTVIGSISPESQQVVGQAYMVNVTVTGDEPSGEVTISDGDSNCVAVLDAAGEGSCGLTSTSVGTKSITAEYAGDDDNEPSSALAFSYQIVKADLDLSIVSPSADDFEIAGIPYTVEVSLAGYNPTGSIEVSDGAEGSCTIELPGTSCELTSTTTGEQTITASYAGDDNNNGAVATVDIELISSGPFEVIFSIAPSIGIEQGPLLPNVVVEVLDAAGVLVEDDNATEVTISLETNPTGAALSGTLTLTVDGGQAQFADLSIGQVGEGYRLRVVSGDGEMEALSEFFDVVRDRLFQDRFED